jgi:competence protein ComFC
MLLMKVRQFFLNLFFPKKCLGCGKPDIYLCQECFNKIQVIPNNSCFFCGKISWQGKICLEHKSEVYLDRIISATEYRNPLVRDLIKGLKYSFVQELTEPLSQLLIKALSLCGTYDVPHDSILIVPIPLHERRLRYRGFNQAELLAQKVAQHFNLEISNNLLTRKVFTEPQAKFKEDYEKRRANLKNIFVVDPEQNREKPIAGKIIILVDDVATTGTTLIEAAKVLKKNNAKEVWALTVAKG